jgi:hypothetical protein
MAFQQKRRTQTTEYWVDEFAVHKEDVEYLYDWLMEEDEPRTLDQLGIKLVERRCQREEVALAKGGKGAVYQPQDKFEVGQRVVFPVLDYTAGQVLAVRPGDNPRYGAFSVIQVQLENEETLREFAAEFSPDHPLKHSLAQFEQSEGLCSPPQLYERYGEHVHQRLTEALQHNEEFVHLDDRWFLRGLLPEVTPFHLNIAEAMIDQVGEPLTVTQLLEEVELAESTVSNRMYALGRALSQDSRFARSGSGDETTWYLNNLIPAEVRERPVRLVPLYKARGGELLNRELHDLALELGDEADQLPTTHAVLPGSVDSVQIFLTYPHRREGTLPLTAQALGLLTENPPARFMVTFIDQRNEEELVGWMMPAAGYASGLGDWYQRHELPIGSVIELRRGDEPFTFWLVYDQGKRKAEWIREAKVLNGHLTFSMQRKAYTCRYDKHLLIEEGAVEELDELWVSPGGPLPSLFDYLTGLFPELAKLSGQGLVHAKSLYSAVNLTRRCGSIPVFAELTRHACFDPVGNGNWVYDESLRNVTYSTPEEMSRRPSSRRQDVIVDRIQAYGANNEDENP